MERFADILRPHIRVSKISLSYVEELFPDLKDNLYIVIHKNVPDVQHAGRRFTYENEEKSSDECSMNVGGSPLEYSFGNCEDFDDTIFVSRHNWRKEEESYLPLSRNDACNTLNACLEYLGNNAVPVLALCDGKDPNRSRLIGSVVCGGRFTTLEVVSTDTTDMVTVRTECHKIMQEHLERSLAQKCDVKVSVFNNFDLYGIKQGKIDWDKTIKSDFEGSINIETYSNNLILEPRQSKNTLIAEINAGWKGSPLRELRQQLHLLMQYLSIIDECNKKDIGLQEPIKFKTPYLKEHDTITEELNKLLDGSIREVDYIDKDNCEIEKLLRRVQNVSSRYNVDFTDLLWDIIIGTSEYSQMVSYIKTILEDIVEHKFIPQVNDTNSTRFIKHISALHRQETSHLLVGSVPLELIVDLGFEKLTRDYLYILRGARYIDLYNVRQKFVDVSSGIFNMENYRKNLVTLAQIHICLECMLLIEAQLECPIESLQDIFVYAYKEFLSEQSPLQHYTMLYDRFYTLTIPLPNAIANELNKMNPTVWRAILSSNSAGSKLTTTTYYSKMPIFPTNIYPTDDVSAQEIVYGLKAISLSTKFEKINPGFTRQNEIAESVHSE